METSPEKKAGWSQWGKVGEERKIFKVSYNSLKLPLWAFKFSPLTKHSARKVFVGWEVKGKDNTYQSHFLEMFF